MTIVLNAMNCSLMLLMADNPAILKNGLVFSFKAEPKRAYVIVDVNRVVQDDRNAPYYRTDITYVPYKDVIEGKRGSKEKKAYIAELSCMSGKDMEPVKSSEMVVQGIIKLKRLKEVVKVIEKAGWAVA